MYSRTTLHHPRSLYPHYYPLTTLTIWKTLSKYWMNHTQTAFERQRRSSCWFLVHLQHFVIRVSHRQVRRDLTLACLFCCDFLSDEQLSGVPTPAKKRWFGWVCQGTKTVGAGVSHLLSSHAAALPRKVPGQGQRVCVVCVSVCLCLCVTEKVNLLKPRTGWWTCHIRPYLGQHHLYVLH